MERFDLDHHGRPRPTSTPAPDPRARPRHANTPTSTGQPIIVLFALLAGLVVLLILTVAILT